MRILFSSDSGECLPMSHFIFRVLWSSCLLHCFTMHGTMNLKFTGLFRIMIKSVLITFGFYCHPLLPVMHRACLNSPLLSSYIHALLSSYIHDDLHHILIIKHLFPLNLTPYGFLHRAHHSQRPCEGCGPESVSQGLT
jgi:hypothetical protein